MALFFAAVDFAHFLTSLLYVLSIPLSGPSTFPDIRGPVKTRISAFVKREQYGLLL
jgi:hypothetical protein